MRIWTDDEIKYLIDNYPQKGSHFCAKYLHKSVSQVRAKINRLKVKKLEDSKYQYESFKEVVRISINLMDVCRNLNISTNCGNRNTIRKYINFYGIDTSHFFIPSSSGKKPLTLDEILIKDSLYTHSSNLKYKLFSLNLKERKCEMCGQGEEWMGKKMFLILDHINGIHNDNRIENLRIVCGNCNATLETSFGKKVQLI